MKKLFTPLCIFLFFSASAQVTQDDINLVQSMYGKEKRTLVQEYMAFTDSAKATAFWKEYDAYETERKKLSQDFIGILQNYADNYATLDDKKADELVTKMSANNIAFENLYMKHYKKMKAAVGALQASQFIQLEAYLKSVIKTVILDDIPFIGEIDRTRKPMPQQ
jgi:hypothetical protein